MTESNYLRFPNVFGELVTFVADDQVWLAPTDGGRAWRLSHGDRPPRNPHFSRDGLRVVWTEPRGSAHEVISAPVDGGESKQHTFWGDDTTRIKGVLADGRILVTSSKDQADARLTWGYALDLVNDKVEALQLGPLDKICPGPIVGDERPVVLASVLTREPAAWKRYRGGTAGKLWIDRDGSGEFERLVPQVNGNLADPMWIQGRIVFVSDHEGYGNLYSVTPNGEDLRRHTDIDEFYLKQASTDGKNIVFVSGGRLFRMEGLDSAPTEISVKLSGSSNSRSQYRLNASEHLNEVVPLQDRRASLVETHGTIHRLTHKDGPARQLVATPGVRHRLPRPVGESRFAYIADVDGFESLFLAELDAGLTTPASVTPKVEPEAKQLGETDGSWEEETVNVPGPVSATSINNGGVTVNGQFNSAAEVGRSDEQTPSVAGNAESAAEHQGIVYPRRISLPNPTRVAELLASPDGSKIAVGTEFGQLLLVDVDSSEVLEVAATPSGSIEQLAFSPNSQWLAWVEPLGNEEHRSRVMLLDLADPTADPLPATDGRFIDFSPSFTLDGKYLALLSARSFDPSYDSQRFDLGFPASIKPYLLALSAHTASPFGSTVTGAAIGGGDSDGGSNRGASASLTGGELAPTSGADPADTDSLNRKPATTVDPTGLISRLIAVPVAAGNFIDLQAAKGGLLWQVKNDPSTTGDGRATAASEQAADTLSYFDLESRTERVILDKVDSFRVDLSGQSVVAVTGSEVLAVPAATSADDRREKQEQPVDLSRIVATIDPVATWRQAFEEAWRLQRDLFYTPDMAGIDWLAVKEKYSPLVERLRSQDELIDLLWELHGELGTSHAYVRPKAGTGAQAGNRDAGSQGYLGARFEPTAAGWRVSEILESESADQSAVSPLRAPGVAVQVGEVLVEIGGVSLQGTTPERLLAGTAEKTIELTVAHPDATAAGAGLRRVSVTPLASERQLTYHAWVRKNRQLVQESSKGAFGYLHIPDMMPDGWAQLHRDLEIAAASDALVIDVRRNRGGHTSELVAELISRRMDAWTFTRHGATMIYPGNAPRGPVVIVTDEFAGSDGDIITAVTKLRGIGPIVGTRTWGGVVGIDNKFSLIDGTGVTQPRYAFWFRGGQGFEVENYGVDPDIEVAFPPHAHREGSDPQLEAAISTLSEMRREIPTVTPPELSGYRNLAVGPLPPRASN